MKVVAYGYQFWFLLQEDKTYYLSVRCEQSFVGYEVLLQLSADEWREYHALGRVFIDYLAARINYWPDQYKSRNISPSRQLGDQVSQAVQAWKDEGNQVV